MGLTLMMPAGCMAMRRSVKSGDRRPPQARRPPHMVKAVFMIGAGCKDCLKPWSFAVGGRHPADLQRTLPRIDEVGLKMHQSTPIQSGKYYPANPANERMIKE